MIDFLHTKEILYEGDTLRVQASHNCHIRLLDDRNFKLYKKGKACEYHGGLFENFPASIVAPDTKKWNIAIDLAGAPIEYLQYSVLVIH